MSSVPAEPKCGKDAGSHQIGDLRRRTLETPEARELCQRVAAIPFWFHSIGLGYGVITPGHKSPEVHAQELASFRLPDLHGKSVLDIGAWDGFYSFAAERLGAARVVAMDHFVWQRDWAATQRYKAECRERGVSPQPWFLVPELSRVHELPGKRGFDLAHEVLQSRVEAVFGDFMKTDLEPLGQFDVVLYLGVLYHMENLLESLKRVRRLTKGVAIIETEAMAVGGFEDMPFCEFFPVNAKLLDDPSNFWAPNASALVGLCQTAGFTRAEVLTTPPVPKAGQITRYRLVAHAFA